MRRLGRIFVNVASCFNLFQLEVRAFDLGEPSLDSTVSIQIRVRQVVTVSPESGVGFAQLEHRVDLPENVERGGLVVILPLEKKPPVEKRLRIRYVRESLATFAIASIVLWKRDQPLERLSLTLGLIHPTGVKLSQPRTRGV